MPKSPKSNLKVQLTDFSKGINTKITQNLLPLNYATNSYNFNFNKQSLSTGLGIKEFEFSYGHSGTKTFVAPQSAGEIVRFWQYTRYEAATDSYIPLMMWYCGDKSMYYSRFETQNSDFVPLEVTFDDIPNGINYRVDEAGDCFFACSKQKIMRFSGRSSPEIFEENVPRITTVALHAGRLFATVDGDQNVLWFSDDLNPTNWNVSEFEGGFIELTGERGVCKKVIESNNYLNVIREFGITRVTGWGLQDDFTVKNMYLTTGKLYHETAMLCGHIIIMLCSDGLYYFDGSSMNKLNFGIDEFFEGVDNRYAVGAFLDGKYYLACKLNYKDNATIGCESGEYKNNTLIELDLNTWEINIARGLDIRYMSGILCEDFTKLGVLLNSGGDTTKLYEITHSGDFNGEPTQKYWVSPLTDMGYPQYKKVLKYLTLNTISDVVITIKIDEKSYDFDIKGDKKPVRIPINLQGSKFSIAFSTDSKECEISNPVLQVSLI